MLKDELFDAIRCELIQIFIFAYYEKDVNHATFRG
jgi:hypothetical protein